FKIAVFGEWNTTNLGDKAIIEGVNDLFGRVGCNVNPYNLGSLTPINNNQNLYSLSSETIKKLDNIRNTSIDNTHSHNSYYQSIKRKFKRYFRPVRQQILIRHLIPQLKDYQAIVVGGGALLSDLDLHFPYSLRTIRWASEKLQIPLFCLGCSAEGEWSNTGINIIADFVKSCQFIAARDIFTANRLEELVGHSVPIFGDFALQTINQTQNTKNIDSKEILAINVMKLSRKWKVYQQKYEEILIRLIGEWLQKNSIQ
ncbi:MAG: polysaccharide pyruvyl transferase family protein, partial [Cyanobacteria bacterium J06628_3]